MKAVYFLIGSFAAGEVIRLCWMRIREPFGGLKGLKLIPGVPDFEIGTFYGPILGVVTVTVVNDVVLREIGGDQLRPLLDERFHQAHTEFGGCVKNYYNWGGVSRALGRCRIWPLAASWVEHFEALSSPCSSD